MSKGVCGYFVAGTGPRPLKIADQQTKDEVARWIYDRLTQLPVEQVLSGMAEGFDEVLAKVSLHLDLPTVAVIPSSSYGEYYWGENSLTGRDRLQGYNELVEQCDYIVMVRDHHMFGAANRDRNEWLVKNAHLFLTLDWQNSRGTQHCLRLARQADKMIEAFPERNYGGYAIN